MRACAPSSPASRAGGFSEQSAPASVALLRTAAELERYAAWQREACTAETAARLLELTHGMNALAFSASWDALRQS